MDRDIAGAAFYHIHHSWILVWPGGSTMLDLESSTEEQSFGYDNQCDHYVSTRLDELLDVHQAH